MNKSATHWAIAESSAPHPSQRLSNCPTSSYDTTELAFKGQNTNKSRAELNKKTRKDKKVSANTIRQDKIR